MEENKNKMIYYISDAANGVLYIIDSEKYRVIKKFKIGQRPENIIIDSRKYAYIASSRNNKITIIDNSLNIYKSLYIPNNGSVQADFENKRIYVSNTDEVCIYSLLNEEKINSIKGFIAAECIRLSPDKKYIFVLDVLQNVIKVYDILKCKLVTEYREVGNSPQFICIEESGNYIYVANKNFDKRKKPVHISVIEIQTGKIERINFNNQGSISCIEQKDGVLYALNTKTNKVDIIDIAEKKYVTSIETTLRKVQKIKLSADKKVLIAAGKTYSGKGALEEFDISDNTIINTFVFYEEDVSPCAVAAINVDENMINYEEIIEKSNKINYSKYRESHLVRILAKVIVSSYSERIIFNKVKVMIASPGNANKDIEVEKITFRTCHIIDESKNMEYINNKYNNLVFEYCYYIPYSVYCIDGNNEKYIVEGKIKGKQKTRLRIPDDVMQKQVEFVINSYTKLIKNVSIKNNVLEFSVSSVITTKAVADDEIQILDYGEDF